MFSSLLVVVVASATWALGENRISQWKAPDAQVLSIPAGPTFLPRYPVEGETAIRPGRLALGDRSPVQIFHRFTLEAAPGGAWSVLLPEVDGSVELYVNGVPMKDSAVASEPGLSRAIAQGRLWIIPRTYFHSGENRIDLMIEGSTMRPLASGIYLGPESSLRPAALQAATMIGNGRGLILQLSLIAAVANLIAAVLRAPLVHLAIAAVFAAVTARVLISGAAPTIGAYWPVAEQLLVAGAVISMASGLRIGARPPVRTRRRSESGVLALAGILGAAGVLMAAAGSSAAVLIGAATIAVSAVYLVWMLAEALLRRVEGSLARRAFVGGGVGLGVLAMTIVASASAGLPLAGPPFAAEFAAELGLAGVAVLAIMAGTIAAAGQAYTHLRARLDQARIIERQQMALDATAHELDRKARQSAILEERQRMARDVHDGIGGQLASLIAQVRLRRVSMDQVEQALSGGLSELRLLVDSLDRVGETLADALASFRGRVRQQAAATGVTLDWSQDADLTAEVRDPQWILNLYRLMQEAISNALRHSDGDRISVSIRSNDGTLLSVRIEDNGSSFDPHTATRGRGLANMAFRAAELGGTLVVERASSGGGAVVRAEIPLHGPASNAVAAPVNPGAI